MLHVLLIILRIAGIVLALALCLIVIVLAVPIRYSFQMEKREKESIQGRVKVTWFFALIYVKISYIESVFDYRVKIAGYQILGNQESFLKKKEEKQKQKQEKQKRKEERKVKEKEKEELSQNEPAMTKDIPEQKEQLVVQSLPQTVESSEQADTKIDAVSDGKKISANRTSRAKPASEHKKKKTGFIKTIKKKISTFNKKAVSLKEKAVSIRNLYEEYHGGELLCLAKNSIIRIARHILPRKLRGNIRFGFEDPATTGIVTGLAAILYSKYQKCFQMQPDFQESCFETDCKGRGRIHPGFFLILILQLLLNQDVRKCIKLALK